MLVKWAFEGKRRKAAQTKPSTNDEDLRIAAGPSDANAVLSSKKEDQPDGEGRLAEPETTAQILSTQLERFATSARAEEAGDRYLRRIQAQDRATKSRDDKLFSMVETDQSEAKDQGTGSLMPLTQENIEKLAHEQEDAQPDIQQTWTSQGADFSANNQAHSLLFDDKQAVPVRPSLRETRHDSEQTITGHMKK